MAGEQSSAQAAWWYQGYQFIDAANFYQPQADYDGTWTLFDPLLTDPVRDLQNSPSDYPTRISGDCVDTQALTQEWSFADYSHGLRYMSPIESHGSNSSTTSNSVESAFTNDLTTYRIRYSTSPMNVSKHNTLKTTEVGNAQLHMPWQPELQNPIIQYAPQIVTSAYLPLQPTKAIELQEAVEEREAAQSSELREGPCIRRAC